MISLRILTDEVTPGLRKERKAIPAGSRNALDWLGLQIQNSARESMWRGTPSGQVYTRGGKAHVASAPGEPPAVDEGQLVGDIEYFVGRGYVDIGTTTLHGSHWETAPINVRRPWLLPAVEKHLGDIEGRFVIEIERKR